MRTRLQEFLCNSHIETQSEVPDYKNRVFAIATNKNGQQLRLQKRVGIDEDWRPVESEEITAKGNVIRGIHWSFSLQCQVGYYIKDGEQKEVSRISNSGWGDGWC
jgi:hypothetical protein